MIRTMHDARTTSADAVCTRDSEFISIQHTDDAVVVVVARTPGPGGRTPSGRWEIMREAVGIWSCFARKTTCLRI